MDFLYNSLIITLTVTEMERKTPVRRGFLGIAAILASAGLHAQTTDNWFSTVEFNPVFSTQSGADPAFNINYTANRRISDYVSVGVGAGVEETWKFKGSPMLPVFARVHAEDFSKKFSPFAHFDIGYEVGFGDNTNGLMINPVVGVRYGAFSLGVGYRGFKSSMSGSKFASAVSINLAYTFGLHRADSWFTRALSRLQFSIGTGALFPAGKGYDASLNHDMKTHSGAPVGTQTVGSKLTYGPGGALSLALTYPVYRNLYVGLSAGVNLYTDKATRYSDMDFVPGGRDLEYRYGHDGYRTYGQYYDWLMSSSIGQCSSENDTRYMVFMAARVKYKLKEFTFGGKFYPYAQCDIGGYVYDHDCGGKGLYLAPEVGVSMAVGSRHSLDLGIGYTPLRGHKYEIDENPEFLGVGQIVQPWGFIAAPYTHEKGTRTIGALKVSLGYTF